MTDDLAVRCRCGELEGVLANVSPESGNHIVCYCDDCQAFQNHLGRADDVLDEHGGTDIFQTSPAALRLTKGADQLACLTLRPGGTVRWYARCCNTPIGNTLAKRAFVFVGLITACLDRGRNRDRTAAALGPVTGRVFGRHARGDLSGLDVHDKAPFSMILGFLGRVGGRLLRGEHKRSPFFNAVSGQLVVEPYVLSREEFAASRPARRESSPKTRKA